MSKRVVFVPVFNRAENYDAIQWDLIADTLEECKRRIKDNYDLDKEHNPGLPYKIWKFQVDETLLNMDQLYSEWEEEQPDYRSEEKWN